ncbi:DUF2867 domain-containing protein [Actinokineospora bangkokensis]|uniref:NAD(P)-binding domain-containing protein n=1 Tax=Actinokineospora bangkokensis TaxID=1193682 RepID=A0A1Q9LKX7_9PSEU|nr:DUF2867 domain-containing protein [Actinokineospora bangkokensis]OLR92670.1 hypothetical protein BJP25_21820 [Actinokineospora bangkokensis]
MSTCLVIGAGGYVGRPLVAALRSAGHEVRAMARSLDPDQLPGGVVGVRGDAGDAEVLDAALAGVDVAYHLVHSMDGDGFVAADDAIARQVAAAAARAGVRQLVYLGGPRPTDDRVSDHLASRAGVGDVFLDAPVPALVLQASMIIGAGSASLDLLAQAAQFAPVVLSPPWMANRSRPIALADVLHHLVAAASAEPRDLVVELAGPQVLSYLELVQRYARVAGLRRRLPVPVPDLPTRPAAIAAAALGSQPEPLVRALMESLHHDLVPDPADVAPPPPGGATSVDQALREALGLPAPQPPPATAPGMRTDRKVHGVRAPRQALWEVITGIGGDAGWHGIPGAWTLRGALDHLLGGPGLHRGRPAELATGDAVDFWTVVSRDDAERSLLLRADMRLPGTAWLELRARADGDRAVLEQVVTWVPDGLAGALYWTAQRPAHDVVFGMMARGIARAAARRP